MGYSTNTYVYNGGPRVFPTGFALGVLDTTHIQVFVAGELDGLGEQVYRTFVYDDNTENVTVNDEIATGAAVTVQRTVPKDQLLVSFSDGDDVSKRNLDRQALQNIHAAHEVLDGRIDDINTIIELTNANVIAAQAAEAGALASETAAAAAEVAAELAESNAEAAQVAAEAALGSLSNEVALAAGHAATAASEASDATTARVAAEAARDTTLGSLDLRAEEVITVNPGQTHLFTTGDTHYVGNKLFVLPGARDHNVFPLIAQSGAKLIGPLRVALPAGASAANVLRLYDSVRTGRIEIISTDQLLRTGGGANGAVYSNSDNLHIESIYIRNMDRGASFENLAQLRIGNVEVYACQRGLHMNNCFFGSVGDVRVWGRMSGYTIAPGRSAMHVADTREFSFGDLDIHNSVEHGLYISGGNNDYGYANQNLKFGNASFTHTGQSGLKIKASIKGAEDEDGSGTPNLNTPHNEGITFGDIAVVNPNDLNAGAGAFNADGVRLERLRRFQCGAVSVIHEEGSSRYAQYGLHLNSTFDVSTGPVIVDQASLAGIYLRIQRGNAYRNSIPVAHISRCPIGLLVDGTTSHSSDIRDFNILSGRVVYSTTAVCRILGPTGLNPSSNRSRVKMDYAEHTGSVLDNQSGTSQFRTTFTNIT